jgi:hypothetical protein
MKIMNIYIIATSVFLADVHATVQFKKKEVINVIVSNAV